MCKHILSLCKIGASVDLELVHKDGKVQKEHVVNTDGIITDLIMKTNKPIIAPIIIRNDNGYNKIECAFTWDAESETGNEDLTSYANFCPCTGDGIDGFVAGVTKWFVDYMNKIYLPTFPRNKTKVNNGDIKTGLNAFVSVMTLEPVFQGQSKDVLKTPGVLEYCRDQVCVGLDQWSKTCPVDLQKIAEYIREIAIAREKADKEKAKVVTKYAASSIGRGLPSKYCRPSGKEHLELFICEGDSAKAPINDARDKVHAGLLPIRGKFANAFSHSDKKMFENEEVQSLFMVMFGSPYYNKKWTTEDCKFEKIIFATDGDIDGFVIIALLSINILVVNNMKISLLSNQ